MPVLDDASAPADVEMAIESPARRNGFLSLPVRSDHEDREEGEGAATPSVGEGPVLGGSMRGPVVGAACPYLPDTRRRCQTRPLSVRGSAEHLQRPAALLPAAWLPVGRQHLLIRSSRERAFVPLPLLNIHSFHLLLPSPSDSLGPTAESAPDLSLREIEAALGAGRHDAWSTGVRDVPGDAPGALSGSAQERLQGRDEDTASDAGLVAESSSAPAPSADGRLQVRG